MKKHTFIIFHLNQFFEWMLFFSFCSYLYYSNQYKRAKKKNPLFFEQNFLHYPGVFVLYKMFFSLICPENINCFSYSFPIHLTFFFLIHTLRCNLKANILDYKISFVTELLKNMCSTFESGLY